MKTWLRIGFLAVFVAMAWVTAWASLDRNVLLAGAELWHDPWGRATLFDAYFAFLTVFLWIAWRERSWGLRLLWLVLILTLGNLAISAYFSIALARLGKDESWQRIFERVPARAR